MITVRVHFRVTSTLSNSSWNVFNFFDLIWQKLYLSNLVYSPGLEAEDATMNEKPFPPHLVSQWNCWICSSQSWESLGAYYLSSKVINTPSAGVSHHYLGLAPCPGTRCCWAWPHCPRWSPRAGPGRSPPPSRRPPPSARVSGTSRSARAPPWGCSEWLQYQ